MTPAVAGPAIAAVLGLACAGAGLRAVARRTPAVTPTGRSWRTTRQAAAFWFLLAAALLTFPALTVGAHTGAVGPDAGFWLSGVPLLLTATATTAFRPRRP